MGCIDDLIGTDVDRIMEKGLKMSLKELSSDVAI